MKPDTQIFIDAISPYIVIYLQKGTLEAETSIPENSPVLIEANLQRVAARKYFEGQQTQVQAGKEQPVPLGSLNQENIQNILKKEQPLFFRCYTQLLQKSPQAKGQVEMVFNILPSGKVSQSKVAGEQLKDPSFRKCLIEVMSRVDFPRFDGPPIATVFPLKFE